MRYSSELHQSAAYACCLNIMLVHALSVKAMFDSYFIIRGFVVVEKFALFCGDTLMG